MNYRRLEDSEWHRLAAIMEAMGKAEMVPHPSGAVVAIAEDDAGQIQGFWIQQLVWHREPLFLAHPSIRLDKLNTVLNEAFAEFKGSVYYAFTDSPRTGEIAEFCGMEKQPGMVVYKGAS